MRNSNHFDTELEDLTDRSIGKWLKQQSLDTDSFGALLAFLEAKSESINNNSAISKQVIKAILDASNSLEAAGNNELASKFIYLLELMVIGEAASDRKKGVPRII
ncbi:hypothetical protein [Reinekea sp. G2M2-21]|uniref:hypothetical protein n=1 Tax=Reinekea sp. G2M2-21 TaxID=2788942 RepID=UPI0018AA9486|nr:hypothetical protein [Reinekea sp. G2M2-21]